MIGDGPVQRRRPAHDVRLDAVRYILFSSDCLLSLFPSEQSDRHIARGVYNQAEEAGLTPYWCHVAVETARQIIFHRNTVLNNPDIAVSTWRELDPEIRRAKDREISATLWQYIVHNVYFLTDVGRVTSYVLCANDVEVSHRREITDAHRTVAHVIAGAFAAHGQPTALASSQGVQDVTRPRHTRQVRLLKIGTWVCSVELAIGEQTHRGER